MPLISLVVNTLPGSCDDPVQDSDGLTVLGTWAGPPPELDLELVRDLHAESVEVLLPP